MIKLINAAYTNNKLTHLWLQGNRLTKEDKTEVLEVCGTAAVGKVTRDETDCMNHQAMLQRYNELRAEKGLAEDDYSDKIPNLPPRSDRIEVFL